MTMSKNYIFLMVIATFILKTTLLILYADFSVMNPDEENNYRTAINYLNSGEYTLNGKLTAFHGSFTIILYKWIISHNIDKELYITFIHIVSIVIFTLSIPFFYRILLTANISKKIALMATFVYCIYPSNLLYIGNIFLYEKIVLPLLVISFYLIFDVVKNSKSKNYVYFVPIIVALSSLLRAHMILIYFIIFLFFLLYSFRNRNEIKSFKKMLLISILTAITLIFSHIPLLQKNHTIFGHYIISTQVGYTLMQGHNDMARGSWIGDSDAGLYSYNDYSKDVIPNLDKLNEYEESVARKEYTINWIKNNPLKEFELIARKMAIFMLPKNFQSGYNPLNIVVHLLFLTSIVIAIRKKQIDSITLLLVSPFVASLLLSLVFFIDFRWRYFAEPSLILITSYLFSPTILWCIITPTTGD